MKIPNLQLTESARNPEKMSHLPVLINQPSLRVGVQDHFDSHDDQHNPSKFEVNSDTSGCGSSVKSEYLQTTIRLLEERRMFRLKHARQEEEYFEQKLQLLAQLEEINREDSRCSSKSWPRFRDYELESVSSWLSGERGEDNVSDPAHMDISTTSKLSSKKSRTSENRIRSASSPFIRTSAKEEQQYSIGATIDPPQPSPLQSADERLPQQMSTPQQRVEGSFASGDASSNGSGQILANLACLGPNRLQLAARQVIASELPVFSGNPQDWPLFYSAFQTSSQACGYSNVENLVRLQRCLRGPALECVKSRLLLPEFVPIIMVTLERFFGRPEHIVDSLLKSLQTVPAPKSEDLGSLIRFGVAVQNLVEHVVMLNQHNHLRNPMLLSELVSKLPTHYQLKWSTFKMGKANVDLNTFNEFISSLVDLAIEVTSISDIFELRSDRLKKYCFCCKGSDHDITECENFQCLNVDSRWKVVRLHRLCKVCLMDHDHQVCSSTNECNIQGCRTRHNSMLHN